MFEAATHREQDVVARVPKELYVGGRWRPSAGGKTFAVEDPSTADELCAVADAGAEDACAALDAACAAQRAWADVPPNRRAQILGDAHDALLARHEELALLLTLEMGKTLAESRAEVAYAASFCRWFSGEALRLSGDFKVSGDGRARALVMRQPVGPCYLITPWNFPIAMGARKLAPAIAAGCTMVVKPAEQAPLSMLALAGVLEECGLPGGVLNVITTSAPAVVSAPIIQDARLRKLSFTGSTEVGRLLLRQAADNVLRVSMELGGNAPFLVFDDADLDQAVEGALIAKMRNVGEACTAANRFHVAESVAPEFVGRLAKRMSALKVGRGTEEGVDVGPLIDEEQRGKVARLVAEAQALGAECVLGGSPAARDGYFFPPTVLANVPAEASALREEIFGPVAPVATFASEDEAIAAANATPFGLVAYMFTRDLSRALRVSERLETGMVGLNRGLVSDAGSPFGGVKASGVGREGGNAGIEEFLEVKYVAIDAA